MGALFSGDVPTYKQEVTGSSPVPPIIFSQDEHGQVRSGRVIGRGKTTTAAAFVAVSAKSARR